MGRDGSGIGEVFLDLGDKLCSYSSSSVIKPYGTLKHVCELRREVEGVSTFPRCQLHRVFTILRERGFLGTHRHGSSEKLKVSPRSVVQPGQASRESGLRPGERGVAAGRSLRLSGAARVGVSLLGGGGSNTPTTLSFPGPSCDLETASA
ncbi:interferon alpha-inducible protein 27-like protein 2 isoform X1 [Papio anubis]|uniref:interferon alpha-inducible protein 27-like protein 2 isoform X1 n=1 Tax=Papio anubis TaxID=9555 RepID=UPI000B7B976E|nr:interferon alpha-inducible protein 27-like protein 2 isoform X1 [Papio anubis]